MVTVTVPATSANVGAGFDSLGLAVSMHNVFTFEESDRIQILSVDGTHVPAGSNNLVYRSARVVYDQLGIPLKGLRITQRNDIPMARGLGSSSACIVAGIMGANALLGDKLTERQMLTLATASEGHPDNVAPAMLGGFVTSVIDEGQVYSVKKDIAPELAFAAFVPDFRLLTSKARAALPAMVSHKDAVYNLSRAALAIEMPFFQFLIDCAITMAQCTILAMLHCRLRESLPSEPEPVQSGKHHRSTGRLLLGASVAGATLLTFALAFCYLALPRDDELLSMLGGVAPVVTAHRGYSAAAPENTLPAFQLAIDQGCEWAELDVQMTKDGVVMVTHDTSLRRCTGRNENIYDLTYNEVRKLDAGRWFGQKYTGAKVPTLEEVLDLCKGKIQLNIEIKPNAATPELEAETIRIIREKGFAQDCTITSQSYETLCKVKELAPEIRTGYILALGVGSYYDLPAADFFSVQSTFITSGMVQQIHKRSKTISAWTVNREEDASELLSIGVDDLITDKPDMIQQLLSEDADLDNSLVLLRDFIRDLFAPSDVDEPTPEEETIEEAIEDPDELLDAS